MASDDCGEAATGSHELYAGSMAGSGGKTPVARQERRVERFGERHVHRVIGRKIAPQFPDARQQEAVRIAAERKVGEVGERRAATLGIDLAGSRVAADDLRDLDIEQMGRVQRLPGVEKPPFHRFGRRRAEQRFEQGRSVDDNHGRSRSARIA